MLTPQTNKETLQIQKMIDEDVFLICWCLFYLHVFSEVAAHCVLSGTVVWFDSWGPFQKGVCKSWNEGNSGFSVLKWDLCQTRESRVSQARFWKRCNL